MSAIEQVGMLFVFSVSTGAYGTSFRFKEVEDARTARKEFVEALVAYWAARLTPKAESDTLAP